MSWVMPIQLLMESVPLWELLFPAGWILHLINDWLSICHWQLNSSCEKSVTRNVLRCVFPFLAPVHQLPYLKGVIQLIEETRKLSTGEKHVNASMKYHSANVTSIFHAHACLHSCRCVHCSNMCVVCFHYAHGAVLLCSGARTGPPRGNVVIISYSPFVQM